MGHFLYNTVYGRNSGSTYFSYEEMGRLFTKADYSWSDGNIVNNLDPLDGWRLPSKNEWWDILATNRNGATVNGQQNKRWAFIKLSDIVFENVDEEVNSYGILFFPDGVTISGAALSYFDNNSSIDIEAGGFQGSVNPEISNIQLNNFLSQGCAYLPLRGVFQHEEWDIQNCYLSSSRDEDIYSNDYWFCLDFGQNNSNYYINVYYNEEDKIGFYAPAILVKTVE